MKTHIKFLLIFSSLVCLSTKGYTSVSDELNSLGSEGEVVERAKKLDPHNRYQIVQQRAINRHWKVELSTHAGMNFGGDSYYKSQNYGAQIDLHITPRWSLGVRYSKYGNSLTSEGKRVYDYAAEQEAQGQMNSFPGVHYPDHSILGVFNYYPIYGKLNLFNQTTLQFDIYALAGAGIIQVGSANSSSMSSSNTFVAGGGIGFWITQHFTTRLEVKYQYYKEQDKNSNNNRDLHLTNLGFSIGYLF